MANEISSILIVMLEFILDLSFRECVFYAIGLGVAYCLIGIAYYFNKAMKL